MSEIDFKRTVEATLRSSVVADDELERLRMALWVCVNAINSGKPKSLASACKAAEHVLLAKSVSAPVIQKPSKTLGSRRTR